MTTGTAPSTDDLARALGVRVSTARAALEQLHDGHGLVLHPGSHEVWCAHPFSLVPTGVWVETPTRGWWAPCIWCGLGIIELTGRTGSLHTRLGGESEPIEIHCDAGVRRPESLVVHFPVSAERAWDNVHRFCGSSLVFADASEVAPWCRRHGIAEGDIQPLARIGTLAREWYGGYLDPDWHKWTAAEAVGIFQRCGLSGPTWDLKVADSTTY